MKNISNNITIRSLFFIIALISVLNSCKKDGDGSPGVKAGNPELASISIDSAAGGVLLTVKGTGLGDMRTILFDKDSVPAPFYSTLNTESAILFRVPDTASGGTQNIVLTNSAGKQLVIPFKVLAYPSVNDASNFHFVAGNTIQLTGLNLNDVTKVVLHGTSDQATIVSKTRKQLVITMPSTSVSRAQLDITNATGTTVTKQEFVSRTNNFIVFDDDYGAAAAYSGTVQSWSFDCTPSSSATTVKSGKASLLANYTKGGGGLSLFLGCSWDANNLAFSNFFQANYIGFWAMGDGEDINITIVPDNPWPGTTTWAGPAATGKMTITAPKNQWTYFRIPLSFISGGYSRLDFLIAGSGTLNKNVYFDDMLIFK